MDKYWYTYTMGYYTAMRMNELKQYALWINLTNMTLS